MWRLIVLFLSLSVPICPALAQGCSVSAPALSFPSYNAFSGNPSTTNTTLTVGCTSLLMLAISYEVRLGGGQSGNILGRRLRQASSGNELNYQVYTPSAQVWGNGTQGQSISGFFLLGIGYRSATHQITGTIPAGQQVNQGTYNDALVMTIIY
ncbi:MAG: spore coat U domain-containing protein [Hyphomonas sp.]